MTPAELPPNVAIKVLRDGYSRVGGTIRRALPTLAHDGMWTPGAWESDDGTWARSPVEWHVTVHPAQWWTDDPHVVAYLAEHTGAVEAVSDGFRVARMRLWRPLDAAELAAFGIYTTGMHDAAGLAHVWVGGDAVVRVSGTTEAHALGRATVIAMDNARVHAKDAVVVVARGDSVVEARGSAVVQVRDRAVVRAKGYAVVQFHGSGRVHVADNAVATGSGLDAITRDGEALIVDYHAAPDFERVVVHRKGHGLDGWRHTGDAWRDFAGVRAQRRPRR